MKSAKQNKSESTNAQSVMPMTYSSDASGEKDTLIDEMQEKIGNLLKSGQDLNKIRQQADVFRQNLISQKNEFDAEKKKLTEQIESLKLSLKTSNEKSDSLQKENNGLHEEVEALRKKLLKAKSNFDTLKSNASKTFEEAVSQQSEVLREIIKSKDKELNDNKSKLKEANEKSSSSSKASFEEHLENERLSVENSRLEEEKKDLEKKNEGLSEEIKALKENLKEVTIKSGEAQRATTLLRREKDAIQIELSKMKEEKERTDQQIIEDESFIAAMNVMVPNARSREDMVHIIREKLEEGECMKKNNGKIIERLKSAKLEMRKKNNQMEALNQSLSDFQKGSQAEESSILEENQQLKEKQKRIETKLQFSKLMEKLCRGLSCSLSSVAESLGFQHKQASIRSILIGVIALKRWKVIVGGKEAYDPDWRNWWWMRGTWSINEAIIGEVSRLKSEETKVNEENEKLNRIASEAEVTVNEMEKKLDEQSLLLNKNSELIEELKRQKSEIAQNGENNVKEIQQKYNSEAEKRERRIEELKEGLLKCDEELCAVKHEICKVKAENERMTRDRDKALTLSKESEERLRIANGEASTMRHALNEKNKDLLSLERTNNEESIKMEKLRMTLVQKPIPSRDADDDFPERLKRMSRIINEEC